MTAVTVVEYTQERRLSFHLVFEFLARGPAELLMSLHDRLLRRNDTNSDIIRLADRQKHRDADLNVIDDRLSWPTAVYRGHRSIEKQDKEYGILKNGNQWYIFKCVQAV